MLALGHSFTWLSKLAVRFNSHKQKLYSVVLLTLKNQVNKTDAIDKIQTIYPDVSTKDAKQIVNQVYESK
jgi:hypothetical protein